MTDQARARLSREASGALGEPFKEPANRDIVEKLIAAIDARHPRMSEHVPHAKAA